MRRKINIFSPLFALSHRFFSYICISLTLKGVKMKVKKGVKREVKRYAQDDTSLGSQVYCP